MFDGTVSFTTSIGVPYYVVEMKRDDPIGYVINPLFGTSAEEALWRRVRESADEIARLRSSLATAREGKPKVVVCCGSSRFVDVMAVCCWLLERDEGAIAMGLHLLPQWYPNVPDDHLAEHEGVAPQMDELHLRKIDLADEIFVVNCEGYIGSSTSNEIAYATKLGKPIRYFLDDKIKDTLAAMMDPMTSAALRTSSARALQHKGG